MKIFLASSALLAACSLTAMAQIQGDGYYRVKNLHKGRYACIEDNFSSGANFSTGDADLGAVRLRKGHDRAISDPSTIIYLKNVGGIQYDIMGQGTSVYSLIGYYANVYEVSSNVYNVYATVRGLGTKYLSDIDDTEDELGIMGLDGKGTRRQWSVYPIATESDEYLGVQSTVVANGTHYATLYTAFPYSLASEGMTAYYIKAVDPELGVAIIDYLNTDVPAYMPVILKCADGNPSNNRLNLMQGDIPSVSDNKMGGTLFCYSFRELVSQQAVVRYDANTMRVLGTQSDGSLAFVKQVVDWDIDDSEYIAANTCWLNVPAGSPDVLKVVTPDEYTVLSLAALKAQSNGVSGIYSVTGALISNNVSDLTKLPKGVYIVNGRKVVNY